MVQIYHRVLFFFKKGKLFIMFTIKSTEGKGVINARKSKAGGLSEKIFMDRYSRFS